jgi:hypothetical protein
LASFVASLRAQVDYVIGRFDHVQVVLDHDDRMAVVDQAVEALQQPIDVGEVQTGRRLVENVEVVLAALELSELSGELDALGFPAGENRRRMAELEVSEPEHFQDADLAGDRRLIRKE